MFEIKNLCKNINGLTVLEDISFFIPKGAFLFIVGKSGSGKTTLLDCLSKRKKPSSGEIIEKEVLPSTKIGKVFQDFHLLPDLTVIENILYPLEVEGNVSHEKKQKAKFLLSKMKLTGKENCFPAEISGGEIQRVGIARALMINEKIIIADEPTSNLDPKTAREIMDYFFKIHQQGTTVIISTHDWSFLDSYPARVIELREGRIIRDENSQYFSNSLSNKESS
ncbi:cell division transport system ATP-binding protein [Pilibacter termitis]|uniref:Cell division transport system ATP-binding protein n=1 Tax=Pilibacter termitis TaxID=263852 RepID=A0A1T4NG76_9ENTE|nr:ABC transporter ATP-binding protein [Pilibacter termitis]SJZ78155.1 cell division transport system ATP-binding protein [Pilibacter termitis]